MVDIPVLDVAPILAQDHSEALIDDLRTAYGKIGFAYITGHGVDRALINAVFDANRQFHALPLEEKLALKVDRTHRGYIPIDSSTDRTSTLAVVTKPNQSASFMIMRDDPEPDPAIYLSGPNRWPDIPGFKEVITEYQTHLSTLARTLLPAMLRAAGVSDHTILQAFETPTTWLRLLHYPPTPPAAPDDLYGSAPHTDFGALTLLAQDPVGGLQVKTTSDHWIDAPYNVDAFVMNVGDMLHRMTNGRFMSTPHQVINRSGRERFSVPFFYDPHVTTTIQPLPGTGAPKFPPQRFDAFLRAELEASYDAHQSDMT